MNCMRRMGIEVRDIRYYKPVQNAIVWGAYKEDICVGHEFRRDLSDQQRKWLHKAADAYGEKVNELDNTWIKNGEDAIKASAKEWYVPSEAEMTKWRAGAIGAWLDAKGTFEPEIAKTITLN